jgi:PTH1 family peptidyl-tRNA hydrolase
MIRLIVGLGNPGTEYERTRHNVGFWWVDGAARKLGATLKSDRAYHGLTARVNRADGPLFLLEPQTYMNLSGKSVAALARFFKIAPHEMLVVHDEIDLPPGQVKLKLGGGVAGHNGLKDLQAQFGSADFWRLRIGVGHPGNRDEVADWVLCKPSPEQRELIVSCVDRTLDALDLLIDGPMERAMMKIHAKPKAAPAAPAK